MEKTKTSAICPVSECYCSKPKDPSDSLTLKLLASVNTEGWSFSQNLLSWGKTSVSISKTFKTSMWPITQPQLLVFYLPGIGDLTTLPRLSSILPLNPPELGTNASKGFKALPSITLCGYHLPSTYLHFSLPISLSIIFSRIKRNLLSTSRLNGSTTPKSAPFMLHAYTPVIISNT